ncbi:MAG: HPr family phosphocarrier protein [Rhodopila sp.]
MSAVTTSVLLTNAIGLHARPSMKLTQLAKTFPGSVEIAVSPEGPWVDAKSPVKVMRFRVPQGALLHIRADEAAAAVAVVALVQSEFREALPIPGDD